MTSTTDVESSLDTVVVTGGLGGAGSWLVDYLAERGTDVVCIDLDRPDDGPDGVEFYATDLTDRGETLELVLDADPDAVVHCAAIPSPEGYAPGHVFENNVQSTYSVLDAAGRAGVPVAWTSSEASYGTFHSEGTPLPEYLPIDEAYPQRPEVSYGTSKVCGEAVAGMVARQYDVPVASIRPSMIIYPGEYWLLDYQTDDPDELGRFPNYWSYVDVRDLVRCLVAAVTADFDGHEAFNVVADDNFLGMPTAEAIEAGFGDLPEDCDLEGEESAFSNRKAADLLGWHPEHSWRTAADEDVPGPAWA